MYKLLSLCTILLMWLLSFIEPSGWSISLHIPEKVNLGIVIASIIMYIWYPYKRQKISTRLVLGLIITFIVIPFILHNSLEGASYLTSFLVVYLISLCKIDRWVMKWSCISIGLLGLLVLNIYTSGSMLNGWNDNSISMVGLFSFIYFSIYLIEIKGTCLFWIFNVITLLYVQMLFMTDCRSGMVFIIISILCLLFTSYVRNIFRKKMFNQILVNTPLLIAFLIIIIASESIFEMLNNWSLHNFDKSIFNGRDTMWEWSLENLVRTDFIGSGKFLINYHNSGIAALSVFGVLGYICWVKYFVNILSYLKSYLNDSIVFGSVLAFSLIFLQQSTDLGFIGSVPNYLPYTILGIGLGRIRYKYIQMSC